MPATPEERIRKELTFIYGGEVGESAWSRLAPKLADFRARNPQLGGSQPQLGELLSEQDAFLIAYPDHFERQGESGLKTLVEFLSEQLGGLVNGVHVLPFFPSSSDDGFAVMDYRSVDPHFGDWADVQAAGRDFRLMIDGVFNHVSRESAWFRSFVDGDPTYRDFFIRVEPGADVSMVARPRTSPLLTRVETAQGEQNVWTTFSEDQIDLNYACPDVLLQIIDVLLFYVEQGAQVIRLDAVAYLWKELGTACIHLPQTHAIIRIFRAVLDAVAPRVLLISETNVPHAENISYFGKANGNSGWTDEAQMVYNFALAPLLVHSLLSGDASKMVEWAKELEVPGVLFNFVASHDGIGLLPARGLLSDEEIDRLVEKTTDSGGHISSRNNPDGSTSPYELNITLYDLLGGSEGNGSQMDEARFLASQAVLLSLKGVPGIYLPSLFGAHNCRPCVQQTGRARSINREKFSYEPLVRSLTDMGRQEGRIFGAYRKLLRARRSRRAFHPLGTQEVLPLPEGAFGLRRVSPEGDDTLLAVTNLTEGELRVALPLHGDAERRSPWRDALTGREAGELANQDLRLGPYETVWLQAGGQREGKKDASEQTRGGL